MAIQRLKAESAKANVRQPGPEREIGIDIHWNFDDKGWPRGLP